MRIIGDRLEVSDAAILGRSDIEERDVREDREDGEDVDERDERMTDDFDRIEREEVDPDARAALRAATPASVSFPGFDPNLRRNNFDASESSSRETLRGAPLDDGCVTRVVLRDDELLPVVASIFGSFTDASTSPCATCVRIWLIAP
jgi:hypothetical protein